MHGSVHWLSLHYLVAQVTATLLVLFMWKFRRQRNAGGGAALTFDGNRNDGLAGLDPGGEPQPVEQSHSSVAK